MCLLKKLPMMNSKALCVRTNSALYAEYRINTEVTIIPQSTAITKIFEEVQYLYLFNVEF